jgi:hypothetical protein
MVLNNSQKSELVAAMLNTGRTVRIQVRGWSMKPLLASGRFLHVAPIDEPLRIGEIALFRGDDGKLTTHRILAQTEDRVISKGDSCATFDGPRSYDQVLGKVVRVEGPIPILTDNNISRRLGLFMSHLYPRLVRLKSAVRHWLGRNASQGAARV